MTQTPSHLLSGLLCRWAQAQVLIHDGDKSPLARSVASGATSQKEGTVESLAATCADFRLHPECGAEAQQLLLLCGDLGIAAVMWTSAQGALRGTQRYSCRRMAPGKMTKPCPEALEGAEDHPLPH